MTTVTELLEALVVHPGDTLIVRLDRGVTNQQAADIRALILKRLPDLADAIVIGAEGLAVYRPEAVTP